MYVYISICNHYNIPGQRALLRNHLQLVSERQWCEAVAQNPNTFEMATGTLRCCG